MQVYDIYSECYHQRPNDNRSPGGKFVTKNPMNKRSTMLVPPCSNAEKATRYLNVSHAI